MRGLAALSVCLFHTSTLGLAGRHFVPSASLALVLFNGPGAVVLFFVLSGFVLRLSLASKWSKPGETVALGFGIARLFRLFPVIVTTICLLAAVNWICFKQTVSLMALIRNVTLLDVRMNGVFWTLQAEVVGSLLILVAFLVERKSNIWPVVLMAAAAMPPSFLGHSWTGRLMPIETLYPFLVGYILAAVPGLVAACEKYGRILLAIALIGFYVAPLIGWVYKSWPLVLSTASSMLLVGVLSTQPFRFTLQWWPIHQLGALSYSFYAIHLLGVHSASSLAQALETSTPRITVTLACFAVSVACSLLLAIGIHYIIERPGNRLGHRLQRLVFKRSEAAPASATPIAEY